MLFLPEFEVRREPFHRFKGTKAYVVSVTSLTLLALVATASADEGFVTVSREGDGLTLESRDVSDSSFDEYRVHGSAVELPAVVADAIWYGEPPPEEAKDIIRRKVAERTAREAIVWSVMKFSLASPRVAAIFYTRSTGSDGTITITGRRIPALPYVRAAGATEIVRLESTWQIRPNASGGTDFSFTIFSDPGGSVPAFLVGSYQRSNALLTVRHALHDAKKLAAGAASQ